MKAKSPGLWRVGLMAALVMLLGLAAMATGQDAAVERKVITLDADSTQVITVLEVLADRTGLNIVTSPEVQGRVISIHLRDTPFEEALNLVVRASGLGYERVGNSILVADPQRLATQTGLTTRVFQLEYANADEVTGRVASLVEQESDRRLAIWLRVRVGGHRMTEVAAEYSYRDGSGIHQVVKRLEERARTDRALARRVRELTDAVSSV